VGTGSTEGASVTRTRGAVRVCPAGDVRPGEVVAADVDGTPVALVHTDDDEYFAIYDECSHAAVALSEGEVDGCTIECWLHGSRFDLRTGRPTGLPATEPVPVYPVEIRDGDVYISLDASNADPSSPDPSNPDPSNPNPNDGASQ
jgi:3-phenylpropionate/trans-cinnamate dioxygenase ferredoxin component